MPRSRFSTNTRFSSTNGAPSALASSCPSTVEGSGVLGGRLEWGSSTGKGSVVLGGRLEWGSRTGEGSVVLGGGKNRPKSEAGRIKFRENL